MDRIKLTVEEYIGQFEGEARIGLEVLRELVRTEVPDVQEGIMYVLIGYKNNNKPLVYFGGFNSHIGVYDTPNTHENFKDDLAKYKQGKGSVQFPLDQPLPINLIKQMLLYRKKLLDTTS